MSDDDDRPLTERELFEKALEEMSAEDVYRGKYGGAPAEGEGDEERDPAEERAPSFEEERAGRDQVVERRSERLMEDAFAGVTPIARDKYRRPNPPESDEPSQASFEQLLTESLPTEGEALHNVHLHGTHRELLKRFRRHEDKVEELNLRGLTRDEAVRRLAVFIDLSFKDDRRFVRVIHGRGKRSEIEPVLKPAVIEWLEGTGRQYIRGYAPEVNAAGDYGSLIVEMKKTRDE